MATEAKTKELIRPIPATWWLQKKSYTLFMIRDVTSVFIAGYCVFLMVLMLRAYQSPNAFYDFFDALKSPLSVILHLIALAFAVYHSVTFFGLTPRVVVVFRGEEKLPESLIVGAHYAAWVVVSLIVLLIALV